MAEGIVTKVSFFLHSGKELGNAEWSQLKEKSILSVAASLTAAFLNLAADLLFVALSLMVFILLTQPRCLCLSEMLHISLRINKTPQEWDEHQQFIF